MQPEHENENTLPGTQPGQPAFAAGVMAIGLKTGEIEDSYLRVVRMLALPAMG